MVEDELPSPDSEADDFESKTRRKKEMLALQDLGQLLTELRQSQLDKCDLPTGLQHAIDEYKRIPNRRGAKKRQLQFIGKLMRDVDIEPIRQMLDEEGHQSELEKRRFHRLESLRDQLLTGDQAILDELIGQHDNLDIQFIRQLIRQAQKEAGNNKPPAAARKLFVYLRELPET